jgi:hypothetical protein
VWTYRPRTISSPGTHENRHSVGIRMDVQAADPTDVVRETIRVDLLAADSLLTGQDIQQGTSTEAGQPCRAPGSNEPGCRTSCI